jgi:hypothetical protein
MCFERKSQLKTANDTIANNPTVPRQAVSVNVFLPLIPPWFNNGALEASAAG